MKNYKKYRCKKLSDEILSAQYNNFTAQIITLVKLD